MAVSLGCDAETKGVITGGIAEAFYSGVPEYIRKEGLKRLPTEFVDIMSRFYKKFVVSESIESLPYGMAQGILIRDKGRRGHHPKG